MDLRTTRTIRSTIEIRAPIDVVWGILTDFAAYPEWNPIIRQLRGKPRVGGRVTIRSHPPGARPLMHRPRILAWSPPNEMRWRATVIAERLFTGEHGFRLEANTSDRVRFVQDETFHGLLVPLYALLRLPAKRRGFAEMNQALRDRAERAFARMTETATEQVAEQPARQATGSA